MIVPERLATALADRYRIERELGQGGMATVYLAEDLKHKRKVALKVLKPELAAVLGAERFVQEITTTAALQHPHILPLFDSGEVDGFLYYVMPFIDGETLRGKLDRETQLGIEVSVRIAGDVASALHYAHEHGVIHRDIKPENILLHDGRPMVADFGIALAVSAAAGGRMTETGLSLGTPHYMSPEQATAEKDISARSDVYSLASVLYEMLAGQPPHLGGSAQQIIMKIIAEPVEPVTRYRKSVPPNVAAAVAKALEKLPADRFETARAFADALANPGFAAATTSQTVTSPRRQFRSSLTTVLALLAIPALLLAAWGWLLLKGAPQTSEGGTPWVVDLGVPDSAGFSAGMALSADGSLLLYGGGMPGNRIWMRQAGTVHPTPILGTTGGCCPALSPDGQRVAFVRGGAVHVIPLTGGTSIPIGRGLPGGDDLAWTTDGYLIGGNNRGGLLQMAATGGPVTAFTVVDSTAGERAHWSPRALPDGQGILFSIVPLDESDTIGIRIGVVGPRGGSHSVLLPGRVAAFAPPGHLLVVQTDGTLVAVPFDPASRRLTGSPVRLMTGLGATGITTWLGYFAVGRSGRLVYIGGREPAQELVWVRRSDGELGVDNGRAGHRYYGLRLSANGRWLALPYVVTENEELSGMEVRNLETGATSRLEEQVGAVGMPSFTRDGRALVYRRASPGGGEGGIYRVEVGRTGAESLLLADSRAMHPALSADERTLYFLREGPQGGDFIAMPLDDAGGAERVLLPALPRGTEPSLSPDERWVAFTAAAGGVQQVVVRSTDPSRTERWEVGVPGGSVESIRWAPNGQELFFATTDSMVVAPVSGGAEFTVGRLQALFPLRGLTRAFDIGPDGRFVFTQRQSGPSGFRLMMVDDWRALMRNP